jgi:hypothetical protein
MMGALMMVELMANMMLMANIMEQSIHHHKVIQ